MVQMESALTSVFALEIDPRDAALREVEEAIGLVNEQAKPVELSPQNAYIRRLGTRAGPIARFMLRHRKMKYWMRTIYHLTSLRRLKKTSLSAAGANDYWQAGKSVAGIHTIESARDVVKTFAAALEPSIS